MPETQAWVLVSLVQLAVDGKPVYMRGRAILDAHLYQLEQDYKFLSTATEVIISGTSAGELPRLSTSIAKARD